MMRIGKPDLFVTWCALKWDLWLQDSDESGLDELIGLVFDLNTFLEDLVNMAATFHKTTPAGIFCMWMPPTVYYTT